MSDGPKEYRFQLVVRSNTVKMVMENGEEYEYPRDAKGVREVIRFIVGSRKYKQAPSRFNWTANSDS